MKKYISIVLLTLAIAQSSCKKDFLSLEKNPNVPSAASAELLLSGSLKQAAVQPNSNQYVMYAAWNGYLSYSTGFQVNTALEQYIITTSTYDVWTPYYLNIANFQALSTSGAYYAAIAKIMIVVDYEALVDNYNDVPYTQAEKGTTNLTPAYDKGPAIYADLMKQLDAAITAIQAAPASTITPGSGDIVFKGNMANWIVYANTLKLKLAIRQSNLSNTAAVAAVQATSAIGYVGNSTFTFTPTGGSPIATTIGTGLGGVTANPGYLNSDASGGQQSPMILSYGLSAAGTALGSNTTYQANAYAADYYYHNNDPRLDAVYSSTSTANATATTGLLDGVIDSIPGVAGTVVASPFGDGTPPNGITPPSTKRANLSPSKFGPGVLKSQTMNANIMSGAEAFFLEAEGVARGYITGNAAALYKAGVEASFVDDLLTVAQADTYIAQAAVAYPTGGSLDAQVQAIIMQKWAALNLYGAFEAFNEYRRTGYPNNIPVSITPGSLSPGTQVTRIPYPFIEYATNAANVGAEGTINVFTSKIFWAK